ncbi:hypothetical protein GGS21DRAFT_501846 [Xylaria nigripes]|nr:hypothetical protein GGS21DRAFT_501846 [Xylaria nigripes]
MNLTRSYAILVFLRSDMFGRSHHVLNTSNSPELTQAASDWPGYSHKIHVPDRRTRWPCSKNNLSESHWNSTKAQLVTKWLRTNIKRRTSIFKQSIVKKTAAGQHAVSNQISSKTKRVSTETEQDSAVGDGPRLRISDVCKEGLNEACVVGRNRESSSGRDLVRNTDHMEQNKAMVVTEPSKKGREDSDTARILSPEEYIDYRKELAVEKVMASFHRWLDKKLAIISYTIEASEATEENDGSNYENRDMEDKKSGGGNSRHKRQIGDDDIGDPSGGDENGRDGGGSKRIKKDANLEEVFLACPFYKHNPKACEKPGCQNGAWRSIHRVKEHLYRVHLLPKYKCPRCNLCFDSDKELQTHLRADDPCKKSNAAPDEGIDQDTERKLRERKKHNCDLSETQRWKDMYALLFPGVDRNEIPSPYPDRCLGVTSAGNSEERKRQFKRFERRMRQVLPRLVKQRVVKRFDQVGAEVLRGLSDIVQSSVSDFFKNDMPQDGGTSTASPSVASRETSPGLVSTEEHVVPALDHSVEPDMDLNGIFPSSMFLNDFDFGDLSYYYDPEDYGVDGTSLDSGYRSRESGQRVVYEDISDAK